uniref:Uncharacterized protein n=1 Tax=Tanacetum cinerariifolium TaxID=118510 RepID=A0A6L2KZX0_TANCI|nr:hypothetical protein [Tanacetum cinerariifolium]
MSHRHNHKPATLDTKSEPEDAPSETREFEVSEPSNTRITSSHSSASSDSTTPLSPDHPLAQTSHASTRASDYRSSARIAVRTQLTLSPSMSARIAEAVALSPSLFHKRYRSSYETLSPSSSLTLPIRKRYQGTSKLIEDTKDESLDSDTEREGLKEEGHSLEDEGPGSEEVEEAAPEDQQQAVPVVDTTMNKLLGLGYRALRHHDLELREGSVPSTFEIGQSFRSMSEQQGVEETPTPRPLVRATWVNPVYGTVYTDILIDVPLALTTPAATISVGEDEFLEVGAYLELHKSILRDNIQRLGALPPTLFEGYDRDLRELYTRSRDVRNEIFS